MLGRNALFISLFAVALLSGCGGHKGVKGDDPYTPERVASAVRGLKFHNVILHPYTVQKGVDEPGTAAEDCHQATLEYLAKKNIFTSVKTTTEAAGDADTLAVDADVQSLRIVSGGARFWAGAFAGSSHMTLVVVAKDSSGGTVGQRAVSDANNAMGAAWSFGASDRGLPGDMGPLVADAIIQLAQQSAAATGAK
jgi:hypothetical protein